MRERIVLAPGLNGNELTRSLALHGVNCIGLRICGAAELARLALMRSGVSIADDFVSAREEAGIIAEAVAGEPYFCAEDSGLALRVKGYACYGGNRLYPCDWNESRDCITRLYEKKDNPNYANTLGYIYYYGRCNGGVPEYEKAFHYFGIAAANGQYEGMYKLADMYRHGYACKKSSRTARALYGMVYDDSFKSFLKGEHANFADAALRMGNVYAKGIGEKADPAAAYYYYVQADYAAKLRAQENDFFGNTTVVINIRKALEETREQLPDGFRFDFCDWNDVESRFEIYYDDELVAWSKSEEYRFYGNPAEEPSGPEYRLASARFSASGRSYDYICEDPSVQAGDTVIVEGYDGETEVEVTMVIVKRESELGLPAERYKKIIRKA